MADQRPAPPVEPGSPQDIAAARRELSALAVRHARPEGLRWEPVPRAIDMSIAADAELEAAARRARAGMIREVIQRIGLHPSDRRLRQSMDALIRAPRERFVLPEDIAFSADDHPLPLDREGLATISAPHAYVLTYDLLDLDEGDHLLELGTGTGYGAAVARELVGLGGRVVTIEIDPVLAARARLLLDLLEAGDAARRVTPVHGDARALAPSVLRALPDPRRPVKVAVTYALGDVPDWLLPLLPEGSRLAAPVARGALQRDGDQELVLWEVRGGEARRSAHGAVRYVVERRR